MILQAILSSPFLVMTLFLVVLSVLAFIRMCLGPTTPDRVVAMDTVNTFVVAMMVLLGAAYKQITYVDIAIIYAMISFVSTLYISKYLEEKR